MLASRKGSLAIVELLVDNGADWTATNKVLILRGLTIYVRARS